MYLLFIYIILLIEEKKIKMKFLFFYDLGRSVDYMGLFGF